MLDGLDAAIVPRGQPSSGAQRKKRRVSKRPGRPGGVGVVILGDAVDQQ